MVGLLTLLTTIVARSEAISSSNDARRRRDIAFCLRMIFPENRFPLFRIML
jgi:hypothetical protein